MAGVFRKRLCFLDTPVCQYLNEVEAVSLLPDWWNQRRSGRCHMQVEEDEEHIKVGRQAVRAAKEAFEGLGLQKNLI